MIVIEKYFTVKYIFDYLIPLLFFGTIGILLILAYILDKWEDHKKHKWLKKHGFEKVTKEITFASMLNIYEWRNPDRITIDDMDVNRTNYEQLVQKLEKELKKELKNDNQH